MKFSADSMVFRHKMRPGLAASLPAKPVLLLRGGTMVGWECNALRLHRAA